MTIDDAPAHGGDLGEAEAMLGGKSGADHAWIDLSTGINPRPYPLPALDPEAWARLPARRDQEALIEAAARYYEVPQGAEIVAAPGSEALIHLLPDVLPARRIAIVGPTYGEHARAWARCGGKVRVVEEPAQAAQTADIAVLVNPNNPDGWVLPPDALLAAAAMLSKHNGWLIVDEAFADAVPGVSSVTLTASRNVVALRSFGKFFGLAGLRLGFAVAPPALAAKLRARLGPWPVSGPAIAIAGLALADRAWHAATRERLAKDSAALDRLLAAAGFEIVGGTPLFRLAAHEAAEDIFFRLLRAHIYVRCFSENPNWLRFGLPEGPRAFARLKAALLDQNGGYP